MKVLIASDWYIPQINGVVTSILNLKRELEIQGDEVRILTLSETYDSYFEDGVYFVGSLSADLVYPGARLKTFSRQKTKAIVGEIKDWGPDIIHTNCEFSTYFVAKRVQLACGCPIVHTYHTMYESYTHYFSPRKSWGKNLVKTVTKRVAKHTEVIISPSRKINDLLLDYSVSCPVVTIPSGIDLNLFAHKISKEEKLRIKDYYNIPQNNLLLVYVGRLAKEKDLDEILDFMKELVDKPVSLLIVGDGPYRETLLEKSCENVFFAGAVKPHEIWKYYKVGDIFVSASKSETQGLTYIEALACGLPLLCAEDACLKDIVKEGTNGWEYNCKEVFLSWVDYAIGNRSEIQKMSEHALESAEEFSAKNFAKKVRRVYGELIQSPQS